MRRLLCVRHLRSSGRGDAWLGDRAAVARASRRVRPREMARRPAGCDVRARRGRLVDSRRAPNGAPRPSKSRCRRSRDARSQQPCVWRVRQHLASRSQPTPAGWSGGDVLDVWPCVARCRDPTRASRRGHWRRDRLCPRRRAARARDRRRRHRVRAGNHVRCLRWRHLGASARRRSRLHERRGSSISPSDSSFLPHATGRSAPDSGYSRCPDSFSEQ